MFKVGDRVKRRNVPIPYNEPGATGLSVETPYTIIWIAPNGLCVLENYLVLVNPDYLEYASVKYAIFLEDEPKGYLATGENWKTYDPKLIHLFVSYPDAKEYAKGLCDNGSDGRVIIIYGPHSL